MLRVSSRKMRIRKRWQISTRQESTRCRESDREGRCRQAEGFTKERLERYSDPKAAPSVKAKAKASAVAVVIHSDDESDGESFCSDVSIVSEMKIQDV